MHKKHIYTYNIGWQLPASPFFLLPTSPVILTIKQMCLTFGVFPGIHHYISYILTILFLDRASWIISGRSLSVGSFENVSAAAAAKSLRSCPTLCDPIDGSPSGCPIPGILQPRTLEWVAISFSNAWKWKVKVRSLSCVQLFVTPWTVA